MHKNSWQNRRRRRRSHQQNPWFRQQGSDERGSLVAQQSSQDSGHVGDDEAPSTSSGAAGSSSVPDLPGYYFDPEKKRYFRLLPGHNNCNPLTKEGIRQKEMESKRLQLLEEEDKQKKKIARMGFNASSLLQKSKLGFLNVTSYCRLAHELRVSCMQRKKVQIQSSDPSALASDRFNLILADTNSDRLFTVNDVKVGGSKYGIISLRGLKTPSLKVHMHENLYFTNRKVNSVCWASLNHLDSHILYLLADEEETGPACSAVSGSPGPGPVRGPSTFRQITASAQVNRSCPRTSPEETLTGSKPPVQTAPLLFNGCRSGEIFAIDLRCRNQGKGWKATRLFHDSAVTSVQILQEEQNLMASDMAGTIKLWDLRTTKCIRQYEGHVNEYAYLPLHVHEEEGIVVAVGQDCYTRIWSFHDACLLRTIPSPHPTSKADIPSVAFSSRLGGFRGAPGLLMAVQQDLYCFSYS
ncbi:DDB1- and CUL4-associated factor 4 isoform X2 [Mustela putorius furo]|uniref:DDB1- and CUL4-associated factor 4 isoform X2 n=1 Tax=Mustela putorius furo TaxID=9669 RepID=A0A8U0RQ08_MUSPF|nr:DDB1- and CUL4-associated factor 4 isoform X2 [Mustela putorius furo]